MDITQHRLVPKHFKVTESEKADLLQKYKIQLIGLPKITRTDLAIAKLNVKAGDIVRIERDSKTAGVTNYYRVVIDG